MYSTFLDSSSGTLASVVFVASAFDSAFALLEEVVLVVAAVDEALEVAVLEVAVVLLFLLLLLSLLLLLTVLLPNTFFVLILFIFRPLSDLSAEIFADTSSSMVESCFPKLSNPVKNTVHEMSIHEIRMVISLE